MSCQEADRPYRAVSLTPGLIEWCYGGCNWLSTNPLLLLRSYFLSLSVYNSLSHPFAVTALPGSSASLTVQHTHHRKWYRLERGKILEGFGHEGDFNQHASDFLPWQGPKKLPSTAEIIASAKEPLRVMLSQWEGLLWAYDYDAIWPNLASACRCATLPLLAFNVKTHQPAASCCPPTHSHVNMVRFVFDETSFPS